MTVSREMATAFVESYGQTWQSWDYGGFVELFSGCQGRLKKGPPWMCGCPDEPGV